MPIDIAFQLEQYFFSSNRARARLAANSGVTPSWLWPALNRFDQLSGILPEVVYEELHARYCENPAGFHRRTGDGWVRTCAMASSSYMLATAPDLALPGLQPTNGGSHTPAWQCRIQRALDAQQNDLLRAAFIFELLDLVEPAVKRATTELRECVVAAPSSDEADRYLDEATRCYFYGLFTACAVMCRSVLEEAIKQKLPPQL